MKLCFISNFKDKGYGESTRPHFLSLELKKLGCEILHLCEAQPAAESGIQYFQKPFPPSSDSFINRAANFIDLFFKLRTFEPAFIYVHQFNNAQWAIATRSLPDVPVVFDAHTSLYFECKTHGREEEVLEHVFKTEKEICAKANYIIAASHETKNILKQLYDLPDSKLFVVKNATAIQPVVAPGVLNNSDFVCSATIPFDGFKSNELALEFLFEAAKELYAMNPEIRVQVIGGGEKPAPPVPSIIYTGYVEDLRTTLLRSHICLSPYPGKAVCGGARNKVCDYLALAKAVVSTNEGMRGFSELAAEQHYLEANTPHDFAAAIIRLQNDTELRQKLEANALTASAPYTWSHRAKELDAVFKSIYY